MDEDVKTFLLAIPEYADILSSHERKPISTFIDNNLCLKAWYKILPSEMTLLVDSAEKHTWPFLPPTVANNKFTKINQHVPFLEQQTILKQCLHHAICCEAYPRAAAIAFVLDRFLYYRGHSSMLLKAVDFIAKKSPAMAIAPQLICRQAHVLKNCGDLHGAMRILDFILENCDNETDSSWQFKNLHQRMNVRAVCIQFKGLIMHNLGLWKQAISPLMESIKIFELIKGRDTKGLISATLGILSKCLRNLTSEEYRDLRQECCFKHENQFLEAHGCSLKAVKISPKQSLYLARNHSQAAESLLMYVASQPNLTAQHQLLSQTLEEIKLSLGAHKYEDALESAEQFYEFIRALFLNGLILNFSSSLNDWFVSVLLEQISMVLYGIYCYNQQVKCLDTTSPTLYFINLALSILNIHPLRVNKTALKQAELKKSEPNLESHEMIVKNVNSKITSHDGNIEDTANTHDGSTEISSADSGISMGDDDRLSIQKTIKSLSLSDGNYSSFKFEKVIGLPSNDTQVSPCTRCKTDTTASLSEVDSSSDASLPRALRRSSDASLMRALWRSSDASVPGALRSSSDASLPGALGSSSDASLPGMLGSSSETSVPGALRSSSDASVLGALGSSSDTSLPGMLGSSSETSVPGALRSSSDASVPGALGSSSDASLPGILGSSSDASVPGALRRSSDASLPGALRSSSDVSLLGVLGSNSDVSLPGVLGSNSDVSLPGTLRSSSDASLPDTFWSSSDASVPGALGSSSDASQPGALRSSSDASLPRALRSSSDVSLLGVLESSSDVSLQESLPPLVDLDAATQGSVECYDLLKSSLKSADEAPTASASTCAGNIAEKCRYCNLVHGHVELGMKVPYLEEYITRSGVSRATLFKYSPGSGQWASQSTLVRLGAELKVTQKGSFRDAFNVQVLHQDDPLGRYIGKRYTIQREPEQYMRDVMCQSIAGYYVTLFNQSLSNFHSKVQIHYLPVAHLQLLTPSGQLHDWINIEPYVTGNFTKLTNNLHYCNEDSKKVSTALTHFSYQRSEGTLMLVDLQGWMPSDQGGIIYLTDPLFHTRKVEMFSPGDHGLRGMETFWKETHTECNEICRHLKLDKP